MISPLFLVDIIVGLLTLYALLVLLDKTTGRVLVYLDRIREIAKTAALDLVQLFAGWESAKVDAERRRNLLDFEERTLSQIDTKTAIEMIKSNRQEMRQLR